MSAEQNEAVVRRMVALFQEYWRTGSTEGLHELFTEDFVNHTPGMGPGLEDWLGMMPMFRTAFPDLRLHAEDIIAARDRVVLRLRNEGTHRGEIMGVPPGGRAISVGEIHVYRLRAGKIAERWGQWDALGLLQQIGAVPASAGT
jgi:steroid delta-isomerase-like uncharacterized protein